MSIGEAADFTPKFDAQGLIPAIAVDSGSGDVLMMAWMNREALDRTLKTGQAHYWSRSRRTLWHKGADIVGTLDAPGGRIDIASTRQIEGLSMAMGAPVAYRFTRAGRLVAHVDVLNAGAVRMVAGTSDAERDWIAAAATALLMRVD